MTYTERLKQYKHKETYLEVIEDIRKLIINIKYKENNELQIKLEVNRDDDKTLEMICGILKYYEFSEYKDINSWRELKGFIKKHKYYIGFDDGFVFCQNYLNGGRTKYTKQEVERMHKVNINAI
jgi:hypothetical protein